MSNGTDGYLPIIGIRLSDCWRVFDNKWDTLWWLGEQEVAGTNMVHQRNFPAPAQSHKFLTLSLCSGVIIISAIHACWAAAVNDGARNNEHFQKNADSNQNDQFVTLPRWELSRTVWPEVA